MSLSASTIKTYKSSLSRLTLMGINIDNPDIDALLIQLASSEISLGSQNLYLSSLQWHNTVSLHDAVLSAQITAKTTEIRSKINTNYGKNELSERESKLYISWSTVLSIHKDLSMKQSSQSSVRLRADHLLLSLYVLHPPRRCDYQQMYISDMSITEYQDRVIDPLSEYSNEWYNQSSETRSARLSSDVLVKGSCNYYVLSGYFVFDEYKTYKIYGRQVIKLSVELNDIIIEYIRINNLVVGDSLLGLNYKNYLSRLSSIFELYVNKRVSVDILRHSYLTYLLSCKVTLNDRKKVSLLMGHSVSGQEIYNKSQSKVDEVIIKSPEIVRERNVYNHHMSEESRRSKLLESKRAWYHKNEKKKRDEKKELSIIKN